MKLKELKYETVLNEIVEIIKEARATLLEDMLKRQPYYNVISFAIKIDGSERWGKGLFYSYEIYEEFLYMKHATERTELNDEEKIKLKIEEKIEEIEDKNLGEQRVEFAIEIKTVYNYEKRHKELDLLLNQKAKKITRWEE